MKKITVRFSGGSTDFYFSGRFGYLRKIADPKSAVLLTDEHVYKAHAKLFSGWNTIVLKPGEEYKVQSTVDAVVEELIRMEADRKFTLVGVGGGVVTDLAGYIAAVYMRGIRFGFVPTSILGLVDASIGGKNGIDVGPYKNMVGVIRQPSFILHDLSLLRSLPEQEWSNGFAEIIKHAAIKSAGLFTELSEADLPVFRSQPKKLSSLIEKNALIKISVVKKDEFEKGERRMLNFGHTLGHALETQYELLHGQAVAIGMTYACHISEKLTGFRQTEKVVKTLEQYGLPAYAQFDKGKVFSILKMDKKREKKDMHYILLDRIGKGSVHKIALRQLEKIIQAI